MNEEKKLILEMLKEGKITVSEAEQLLNSTQDKEASTEETTPQKTAGKKFLRVLVMEDDKKKVNVNIPIFLAEAGLKLIPKDKLKIKGQAIDLDEILKLIKAGCEDELVNIDTTEKGKAIKIRVFIN